MRCTGRRAQPYVRAADGNTPATHGDAYATNCNAPATDSDAWVAHGHTCAYDA